MPSANDILRIQSKTPQVDILASIFQVIMVILMCSFRRKEIERTKLTKAMNYSAVACCIAYYIGWVFYYMNFTNPVVIMALTLFPSFAFVSYQIGKQNRLAIIPTILFTILHLIHGIVNFM
ncbi:hypothetical protein BCR26_09705 [Enterococcus rivorum]|uniref:Uncharacterized protein n=1 Tax=Enterococcus rivorum TaxID=762845 RepID=A0A1E5KZW5_9ENTE|nr:hypothetical protein BCR26_09705 [Enterococcus rivorum]